MKIHFFFIWLEDGELKTQSAFERTTIRKMGENITRFMLKIYLKAGIRTR